MKNYLKLMRVHHYIKNILIFVALACSGHIFDFNKFTSCLIAFFSFCILSSVVYIVNDIFDKDKDKMHPVKCKRPIAAGTVSVKKAWCLATVLLAVSIICNIIVGNIVTFALLAAYLVLNLAYSFGLKNIPIIDITILTSGFLIRILYGAVVSDIVISNWLYLTVTAMAFYLSLGKRRNELRRHGDKTRKVLNSYPDQFLDKSMNMCLTFVNIFYALWSMDEKSTSNYGKYLILTVPIVFLITLKYSFTVEGKSEGDPVDILLHDKVLLLLCALYVAVMFFLLYFYRFTV